MGVASYPEYKDSGVTWLGRIPEHWDSAQLGRIVKSFKTGPFGSILHQSDYVSNGIPIVNPAHMIRGRIRPNPHRTISHQTFVHLHEYALAENDIVFSRRGELGRCALVTASEHGYLLGTGSIRVRLLEGVIDPEYLLTSYQSQWVGDFLSSRSVGATMESLNTKILRQLPALIPPIEEQTQIARFLDLKNAQIKKFIRNKRRLIELLKEQKQIVINQAVTRGLDPNVKLKPSGVEWIGDIPEHWEIIKIKRLVTFNPSKSEILEKPVDGKKVVFLPMEKISTNGDVDCSEKHPLQEVWNGFTYFRRGDVVIAKITPCFENGKGAYLQGLETDFGFGTTELIVLRPSKGIEGAFLRLITSTKRFLSLGEQYMTGAAGQQRVPIDFVENYTIGLPTIKEQRDILGHIQAKTAEIDHAINCTEREIDLMREYRTRLISDVVTGQVDVSGIKVPEIAEEELPELDEESTEQDDVIEDEGEKDETD